MPELSQPAGTCPSCGAPLTAGALFCEECGAETGTTIESSRQVAQSTLGGTLGGTPASLGGAVGVALGGEAAGPGGIVVAEAAATPVTAPDGEETPMDVGWTGPVSRGISPELDAPPTTCVACGQGSYVDGYCDRCGTKAPDPRAHYTETPAAWVAGMCDLGRRHPRNEDAMALAAQQAQGSFAAVVVCDGVSASVDSHIASLAAARAAREVLTKPLSHGVGTPAARSAALDQRLVEAVAAAKDAVIETASAVDAQAPNPPSCTIVATLVVDDVAYVGNVGDSRAYWLPDDEQAPARQLSRDDSFAAEQILAGVPRKQAETGPQSHAITRWLGLDSPDDITPHTSVTALDAPGWLLVCSDGLWNYVSEAQDLRRLVKARVAAGATSAQRLAAELTAYANDCGGTDNITVALVRSGPDPAETASTTTDPSTEE